MKTSIRAKSRSISSAIPKIESAQIFGVPSAKYGEEICAWIILKEGQNATEDEIREFCQGQIAHYKIPHYIRFVKEMPMTVTGKPQKFIMRDAMIEELGLEAEKDGLDRDRLQYFRAG